MHRYDHTITPYFSWNMSQVCGIHSSPLALAFNELDPGEESRCPHVPCVDVQTSSENHEGHVLNQTKTVSKRVFSVRDTHQDLTGVQYPYVSYCFTPPETAIKNNKIQGMRTSAHIFRSTLPNLGLSAAPMNIS